MGAEDKDKMSGTIILVTILYFIFIILPVLIGFISTYKYVYLKFDSHNDWLEAKRLNYATAKNYDQFVKRKRVSERIKNELEESIGKYRINFRSLVEVTYFEKVVEITQTLLEELTEGEEVTVRHLKSVLANDLRRSGLNVDYYQVDGFNRSDILIEDGINFIISKSSNYSFIRLKEAIRKEGNGNQIPKTTKSFKTCIQCQFPLTEDDRFCPSCGEEQKNFI